MRFCTPVVIDGNEASYPKAIKTWYVPGAWADENDAAVEAARIAAMIGTTERTYSLEISCPVPIASPAQVMKVVHPAVEGGSRNFLVIDVNPSRRGTKYRLRA